MSTITPWETAVAAVRGGAPPTEQASLLVALMTDEERRWCLDGDVPFWAGLTHLAGGGYHQRPFPAARVDRLGIPGFAFCDGPRGVVVGNATCFPVSMARGATWDPALEEQIGEVIGRELRAVGADLYGGVCINLLRHPAWGRAQETYGEDPHLVGEMGAALTRGVQRYAMATVKHFAANSMENARFKVDVTIDEQALHEVYLPHFRRVVDEGVACVMSAYNSVNGEWCGESHALLAEVLREEWGFDGFVISDWIFGLRDAGRSVRAGLDVEMPYRMVRRSDLDAALVAGETTDGDVEACVTRTLTALLRFAARLDTSVPVPDPEVLACPEHRALARTAAARSIVLLRNESVDDVPVLPLPADVGRLAVIGELADVRNLGDGGSSDVYAPSVVTPLAGLRAALPHAHVVHHDGADLEEAAALAGTADATVVVVGYTRADEGEHIGADATSHLRDLFPGPDEEQLAEAFAASLAADPGPAFVEGSVPDADAVGFSTGGDRTSLRLHDHHEALIQAVATTCPRTIVAVVTGSAVVMEAWRHQVPVVVLTWYAGMEGGHALADVLTGREAPSGRLPFTIPTDPDHLPPFDPKADAVTYDAWHGYWRLHRDGNTAAYPFGFGLSTTSWRLGPATVDREVDHLVVQVDVANVGGRDGSEVVQVYGGRPEDPTRPARRLIGFARVEVPAGEVRTLSLQVPVDRLAVRDHASRSWRVEPGTYELHVAHHADDPDARRLTVEL